MNFWLGTHETSWLSKVDVPLFISYPRLKRYKRALPVARGPWALDSGGFTELNRHGCWTIREDDFVAAVRRYQSEIGQLAWAAPMDWMCEPEVIAMTSRFRRGFGHGNRRYSMDLSVEDHQRNTVENYVRLRTLAPDLPFIPVLQGWTLADYLRCVDLYAAAGVDLTALPLVGIGSVCRRQNTGEVDLIVSTIAALGIALHGFGVKTVGLTRYADQLASADSLAWSYRARNAPPLAGCTHKSCANCPRFALKWREKVLRRTGNQRLPFGAAA